MINNSFISWIKVFLTVFLSIISIGCLLGYFYISFSGLYRKPENRWWVGLLAIGLPLISLTLGLIIWIVWNQLVLSILWPILFLILFVSYLLGQSVTSPYKLADWWTELSRWLMKRKSQR